MAILKQTISTLRNSCWDHGAEVRKRDFWGSPPLWAGSGPSQLDWTRSGQPVWIVGPHVTLLKCLLGPWVPKGTPRNKGSCRRDAVAFYLVRRVWFDIDRSDAVLTSIDYGDLT